MVECIGCRGDGGDDKRLGVTSRHVAGLVECFSWFHVECCINEKRFTVSVARLGL